MENISTDIFKGKYNKHIAGISTGLVQTIVFNPYDRAMYLKNSNNIKFFHKNNWTAPYQGVTNSAISRCISYGYYYTMIDMFNNFTKNKINNANAQLITSGILTGATTSILINPLNVVKYNSWKKDNVKLSATMIHLYKTHGITCFSRGLLSTIKRDCLFSTIYIYSHPKIDKYYQNQPIKAFFGNLFMVTCATAITSPFNFK